jgi:hypothetical protein
MANNDDTTPQRDFHGRSRIPPPVQTTSSNIHRAVISSASHATTMNFENENQMIDLLPENTLDDVILIIGTDQAIITEATTQPATLSSDTRPTTPLLTTIAGSQRNVANRPWQNAHNIQEFATLLYRNKYSSVDDIIQQCRLVDITSRERDLLTVMFSMSNATLHLVADDLQRIITYVVATQASIPDLPLLADLGRLTQRLRR